MDGWKVLVLHFVLQDFAYVAVGTIYIYRYIYQTHILSAEFLLLNVHGGEKAYQTRGQVGKGGQRSETSKH